MCEKWILIDQPFIYSLKRRKKLSQNRMELAVREWSSRRSPSRELTTFITHSSWWSWKRNDTTDTRRQIRYEHRDKFFRTKIYAKTSRSKEKSVSFKTIWHFHIGCTENNKFCEENFKSFIVIQFSCLINSKTGVLSWWGLWGSLVMLIFS